MSGKAEHKAEAPADGAKGKAKLVPMIIAVVAILGLQAGLAVGVVRWLRVSDHASAKPAAGAHGEAHEGEDGEEGEGEEEAAPKKLECAKTPLSKTVSVNGSGGKRYLKATFCLEYDVEKYKEFDKLAEEQAMRIEAATQKVLSSAPMELVMSPAGQDSISSQLKVQINAMLKHHKMKLNDVLVTEWLVQ